MTLAVPALARAFSRRSLARWYSPFSLSSLTAASQISSLLGLAWKASARIERAAGTSPCEGGGGEGGRGEGGEVMINDGNAEVYTINNFTSAQSV